VVIADVGLAVFNNKSWGCQHFCFRSRGFAPAARWETIGLHGVPASIDSG